MTYTLAQLRGFTAAAAQDDRDHIAQLAVATRMAMAAPPADWQLYLAALRGQSQLPQQPGTSPNG
ncbi:hypothetical protein J5H37_12000 [Stenotrophomonas maltophilia]|uniref:hypothetical protein n=1 Tax=Stenotrophomonas maltophilia TaxID=40324 RepID=UPI0019D44B66|nr:hypothetical protein [Stenotrophomonas maltophilia]MBN7830657.1 hypothetical protein [Stenotrophomonas maltophilia]MBN7834884.1 hypothetical protein [Stenotrophomonas maltophilia]MBN7858784.1 hypothetical protein [Stenotrophomonas maltophilia]MBN7918234.1 hypothetical protein [Stenotrophomonas maltophilia]MBO2845358.1 hypothetical protein [Stenotrophomonas maltophilia]